MPGEGETLRYWLDLFTEQTWLEAARRGFRIAGFTQSRWTTTQRIRVGDILICYLTGRSTYVGLLRATGEPYFDETPIWTSQVFPGRVPVARRRMSVHAIAQSRACRRTNRMIRSGVITLRWCDHQCHLMSRSRMRKKQRMYAA